MPIHDRFERTDETLRIEQRHQFVGAFRRYDLGLDTEVAPLGDHALQPIEPGLGGSQHDATG